MKAVLKYAIVVAAGLLLAGCGYKVNYSLSGASIPPDAKTFSVAYFPNNAPMVAPILSSTLTDALRDKFTRQTRLTQVDEGGDFAFEGEITGYTSTTASVSGSSETCRAAAKFLPPGAARRQARRRSRPRQTGP